MAIQLTDEEYYQATNSKQGLESLLTKTCALAVEDALRVLPRVMQSLIVQITDMKVTADGFYKDHPDLKDKKLQVASVLERLQALNPGKAYSELLIDVVKELNVQSGLNPIAEKKPTLDETDYTLSLFEN